MRGYLLFIAYFRGTEMKLLKLFRQTFLPVFFFLCCYTNLQAQGASNYPVVLDTGADLPLHADNTQSYLTAVLSQTEVGTFSVASTIGFPQFCVVQIGNELIFVQVINSTTLDVLLRAVGSTVAAAHPSKATVRAAFSSAHINGLQEAVLALEAKLGTGGTSPGSGKFLYAFAADDTAWATLTAGSGITITPSLGGLSVTIATTGLPSGSGTSGQIAFWNGSSSLTGSNNLFWDSGTNRLGVGTNAPIASLQVLSNASSSDYATKFHIGDGTNGIFAGNATGTGYSPGIFGVISGASNSFDIAARVPSSDDTGTIPLFSMGAQTTAAGAISTRPIFAVYNQTSRVMLVTHDGKLGVNVGTGTAEDKIHVIGDANSSSTAALVRLDDTRGDTNSRNWKLGNNYATDFGQFVFYNSSSAGGSPTVVRALFDKDGKFSLGDGFSPSARFHIKTQATSEIGLIVQGIASQTGNLQEWRNSSATVLAKVDNAGKLTATGARFDARVDIDNDVRFVTDNTYNLGNSGDSRPANIYAGTKIEAPTLSLGASITWTKGSGAPGGSCTTGSLYSRTDGSILSTLYVCENSAWVAK